ncbi:MAG: PQQ-binding-like beta-propeller repeat protein [bacterium]
MKRKKGFFVLKAIFLIFCLCIINNRLSSASPDSCQDCLTATLLPKETLMVEMLDGNTKIRSGIREMEVAADDERNPVKSCYLLFDLGAIPPKAFVDSLTLRLYLKAQNDPDNYQLVKIYNVNNLSDVRRRLNGTDDSSLKAIGSEEVNNKTPIIDFECKIHEEHDRTNCLNVNRSGFALMLLSTSKDQDYSYYSNYSKTKDGGPPCYNVQPRLIVKYSMPPLMRPSSDWSQYNYDPQHSGRTPWKIYLNPNEREQKVKAELKTAYSPAGYIEGDPVVYDNDLFFHTQSGNNPSGNFFITAVSGIGKPLWDQNVEGVVTFQPIVDRCGLMYVVTENRLVILDLRDRGNILKGIDWKDMLRTKQEVSIRSTPTIGYNGALYLSTNRGVYALTPYPDMDILWNYTTEENSFGIITLSKNEATAYVIDGSSWHLVAIDSVDGEEKWREEVFKTKDKTNLPVPVVGKNEYIYVTNGYPAGNYLQILDAGGNTIKKIESGEISRPVIGSNGNAFFIHKDRGLCRCDPSDPNKIICEHDDPDKIMNNDDKLNAKSIIVMNGNDNIYVIDRFRDPQQVKGYFADLKEIFELNVKKTNSNIEDESRNFKDNLLIAPDGSLYTRNDNNLFAITIRDSSIDKLELTKDVIRKGNETTFHAMDSLTLKKEGISINNSKSVIIQSGKTIEVEENVSIVDNSSVVFKSGTIRFNSQFRVKKGARFICKTCKSGF